MKIGSRVWAVHFSKNLKTQIKIKIKVTVPQYVTTTGERHRYSDPNQTWQGWATPEPNHPFQI